MKRLHGVFSYLSSTIWGNCFLELRLHSLKTTKFPELISLIWSTCKPKANMYSPSQFLFKLWVNILQACLYVNNSFSTLDALILHEICHLKEDFAHSLVGSLPEKNIVINNVSDFINYSEIEWLGHGFPTSGTVLNDASVLGPFLAFERKINQSCMSIVLFLF